MEKIGTKKIIILAAAIAAFSFIITGTMQQDYEINTYDGPPKAAIIDQLNDDIQNVYFQEKATEYLETAGYQVELFTTKQLTVEFYKNLPKMNYEYIVFRTHAIGNDSDEKKEPVSIFTGEKYRDDKYITEQLSGQIGKGAPFMSSFVEVSADLSELDENHTSIEIDVTPNVVDDSNPYFLIGAKYVNEIMQGKFPNSVLILGGCSTLSNPSLAESLIKRGASSVVGWDNLVGSVNNDQTMLALLENNLINHMELKDAVELAEQKYTKDSKYDATFLLLSS
jgi:hypothetical protein